MKNLLNEVNKVSATTLTSIKPNNRMVKMALVRAGKNDIYLGVNNYKFYIISDNLCFVCT